MSQVPEERESCSSQRLKATQRGFVFPLGIAFLLWYFAYVLLDDYAHEFMSTPVFGAITIGLLLGLAQFITTFAITTWYVSHANRKVDPLADEIRSDLAAGEHTDRQTLDERGAQQNGGRLLRGRALVHRAAERHGDRRGLSLGSIVSRHLRGHRDHWLRRIPLLNRIPRRVACRVACRAAICGRTHAQHGKIHHGRSRIDDKIGQSIVVAVVGVLMIIYVLIGGMKGTTWVQIIKAGLLIAGAFIMTIWVLVLHGFNFSALLGAAAERGGDTLLNRGLQYGLSGISSLDFISLALALVFGTAGLPHVLMRFYTVPTVRKARRSVVRAIWLIGKEKPHRVE